MIKRPLLITLVRPTPLSSTVDMGRNQEEEVGWTLMSLLADLVLPCLSSYYYCPQTRDQELGQPRHPYSCATIGFGKFTKGLVSMADVCAGLYCV